MTKLNLKELRQKNNITQEKLAFLLECSASLIRNYESGNKSRYLELLITNAINDGKLKK